MRAWRDLAQQSLYYAASEVATVARLDAEPADEVPGKYQSGRTAQDGERLRAERPPSPREARPLPPHRAAARSCARGRITALTPDASDLRGRRDGPARETCGRWYHDACPGPQAPAGWSSSTSERAVAEARTAMKRLFAVALGILTAIGGFVDIGDLVTNAQVGARFGLSLAWVVVLGVIGICVFAEMSGRVAAVSGPARRSTWSASGSGRGSGCSTSSARWLVTLLTFIAEIGGVALALQLVTSVSSYAAVVPFVGAAVWLVLWRAKFSIIENVFGLLGLALIVFAVALWQLGPGLGRAVPSRPSRPTSRGRGAGRPTLLRGRPVRRGDDAVRGVLLLLRRRRGALDGQGPRHDAGQRLHRLPARRPAVAGDRRLRRGGALPAGHRGRRRSARWPAGGGRARQARRWRSSILGFFAATFGAALRDRALGRLQHRAVLRLAVGQVRPARRGGPVPPGRCCVVHRSLARACSLTAVDPIMVTEFSVVFSAVALPLTYFPILVVANDPDYMGEHATAGSRTRSAPSTWS